MSLQSPSPTIHQCPILEKACQTFFEGTDCHERKPTFRDISGNIQADMKVKLDFVLPAFSTQCCRAFDHERQTCSFFSLLSSSVPPPNAQIAQVSLVWIHVGLSFKTFKTHRQALDPKQPFAQAALWSDPELEGWLEKRGGKYSGWKKRYFVLQSSLLFYFTSEAKVRKALQERTTKSESCGARKKLGPSKRRLRSIEGCQTENASEEADREGGGAKVAPGADATRSYKISKRGLRKRGDEVHGGKAIFVRAPPFFGRRHVSGADMPARLEGSSLVFLRALARSAYACFSSKPSSKPSFRQPLTKPSSWQNLAYSASVFIPIRKRAPRAFFRWRAPPSRSLTRPRREASTTSRLC